MAFAANPAIFFAPILLLLFGSIGWFSTYGIAVTAPQHVVSTPDWPTISNTGSFAPESCIFSQIFNLCAFLGYFVALVYHKLVIMKGFSSKLNTTIFIVAICCMFGITLVGNFQFVNILEVHFFGAFLAFIGTIVLEFLVAYQSYRMLQPQWVVILRTMIGVFALISFAMMVTSSQVSKAQSSQELIDLWANQTDGWEWAMGLLHLSFFATFSYEFRDVQCVELVLKLQTETVSKKTGDESKHGDGGLGVMNENQL